VSLLGPIDPGCVRARRGGDHRFIRHAGQYAVGPVLLAFGCAFATDLSLAMPARKAARVDPDRGAGDMNAILFHLLRRHVAARCLRQYRQCAGT